MNTSLVFIFKTRTSLKLFFEANQKKESRANLSGEFSNNPTRPQIREQSISFIMGINVIREMVQRTLTFGRNSVLSLVERL